MLTLNRTDQGDPMGLFSSIRERVRRNDSKHVPGIVKASAGMADSFLPVESLEPLPWRRGIRDLSLLKSANQTSAAPSRSPSASPENAPLGSGSKTLEAVRLPPSFQLVDSSAGEKRRLVLWCWNQPVIPTTEQCVPRRATVVTRCFLLLSRACGCLCNGGGG